MEDNRDQRLTYEVSFTKRCEKRYRKLDEQAKRRVAKTINELIVNPNIGYPLEGQALGGLFSVHSGDYRIVYKFTKNPPEIEVWAVEHRNRVYEELTRYIKSERIVARKGNDPAE